MTFRTKKPAFDTEDDDPDLDDADAMRECTIDAIWRCLALLSAQIGREYEHCGKAACARSRRCRGFACMPELKEQAGERPATRDAHHPSAARIPPRL